MGSTLSTRVVCQRMLRISEAAAAEERLYAQPQALLVTNRLRSRKPVWRALRSIRARRRRMRSSISCGSRAYWAEARWAIILS
ncbi:hypothetical protein ATY41_09890 [Leifsonia xyli subsp. xyli]|uniref:Uncharacterized protein n=1 Tax=Leifsonia xyli subsp. xyli TaxID=59736 RepID=A0A1E2SLA5_LEIXY|nr:hypothetical protein ATY41_09890 [Leifsonia xyli subsp. xyli]